MVRWLMLLAIALVIALLARKVLVALRTPATGERDAATPPDNPQAKLVRCVECGAFVPKADTVPVANGLRCGAGCLPR